MYENEADQKKKEKREGKVKNVFLKYEYDNSKVIDKNKTFSRGEEGNEKMKKMKAQLLTLMMEI